MGIKSTAKKVVKKVTKASRESFGSIEQDIPVRRGHDGQVYRNVDNARSM